MKKNTHAPVKYMSILYKILLRFPTELELYLLYHNISFLNRHNYIHKLPSCIFQYFLACYANVYYNQTKTYEKFFKEKEGIYRGFNKMY